MSSQAPSHPGTRIFDSANTPLPKVALLGQEPYVTIVTNAGTGLSRSGDTAISRWRNDATCDDYGQWCYLKDVATGRSWSAGHQPVAAEASSYQVAMTNDRVTISRRDGDFETLTEIGVDADSRTEARRVSVTNRSKERATIELTSYQEIVLAPHASDRGHRAFSNLFVQTEWVPESGSLLAMRRPRSAVDTPSWAGHSIAGEKIAPGSVSCETDRAIFIGRGRSSRNPVAMHNPGDLSGTVGAVLDPVLSLRAALVLDPGESGRLIFTTFVAKDREEALSLASSYGSVDGAQRIFENAVTQSDRLLDELGLSAKTAARYQNLAGTLLYGIRPAGGHAIGGRGETSGRADLLKIGITGEWPILVATLRSDDHLDCVAKLVTVHRYWRAKGIDCDLVILCAAETGNLEEVVTTMVSAPDHAERIDRPRGVFVRKRDSMTQKQIDSLESTARIRIECSKGLVGGAFDD